MSLIIMQTLKQANIGQVCQSLQQKLWNKLALKNQVTLHVLMTHENLLHL